MNKTARTGLGAFVFLLSSFTTFLFLSRCGAGDGPGGGMGGFAHSYTGSFDAPTSEGSNLLDKTVTFTLSWNENQGSIAGQYQDDHFSPAPAEVTGSVGADGTRVMTIKFASAVDGVTTFFVMTSAASGELSDTIDITSLEAKGPGGAIVFTKNGITIVAKKESSSPQSPSPSGSAPEGAAGEFFAKVKGEYDYFAANTNAMNDGNPWSHGKKYKITVDEDGTITIPTESGENKVVKYGASPADKFEHYDHEEYAILHPEDKTELLAQLQFEQNELFFSYRIESGAFWVFKPNDPGALPSYWDNKGLGFITGTHKHKVTGSYPTGETTYPIGSAVEIVVGTDGKVTGTFGEFTYNEEDYPMQGTRNETPFATVNYYRPNKTTYPRYVMEIDFENEKFNKVGVRYEDQQDHVVKSWQVETKK